MRCVEHRPRLRLPLSAHQRSALLLTPPVPQPVPTTEDEMYLQMFRYTDRLFNIVRPRKLLYIGIDGVAPRCAPRSPLSPPADPLPI